MQEGTEQVQAGTRGTSGGRGPVAGGSQVLGRPGGGGSVPGPPPT